MDSLFMPKWAVMVPFEECYHWGSSVTQNSGHWLHWEWGWWLRPQQRHEGRDSSDFVHELPDCSVVFILLQSPVVQQQCPAAIEHQTGAPFLWLEVLTFMTRLHFCFLHDRVPGEELQITRCLWQHPHTYCFGQVGLLRSIFLRDKFRW